MPSLTQLQQEAEAASAAAQAARASKAANAKSLTLEALQKWLKVVDRALQPDNDDSDPDPCAAARAYHQAGFEALSQAALEKDAGEKNSSRRRAIYLLKLCILWAWDCRKNCIDANDRNGAMDSDDLIENSAESMAAIEGLVERYYRSKLARTTWPEERLIYEDQAARAHKRKEEAKKEAERARQKREQDFDGVSPGEY